MHKSPASPNPKPRRLFAASRSLGLQPLENRMPNSLFVFIELRIGFKGCVLSMVHLKPCCRYTLNRKGENARSFMIPSSFPSFTSVKPHLSFQFGDPSSFCTHFYASCPGAPARALLKASPSFLGSFSFCCGTFLPRLLDRSATALTLKDFHDLFK